jgi:hypothetical protein
MTDRRELVANSHESGANRRAAEGAAAEGVDMVAP